MPYIVLEIDFRRWYWFGKCGEDELVPIWKRKFNLIDNNLMLETFFKTLFFPSAPGVRIDEQKRQWRERQICSLVGGWRGLSKIGIFKRAGFYEFIICSRYVEDCIKDRRWLLERFGEITGLLRKPVIWKKVKTDFLVLEGGSELPKEQVIRDYVLKNGLNIALLVNLVISIYRTILDWYEKQTIDWRFPIFLIVTWFIILICLTFYYRSRVTYVIKEKGA